jgi:hypothetical protein
LGDGVFLVVVRDDRERRSELLLGHDSQVAAGVEDEGWPHVVTGVARRSGELAEFADLGATRAGVVEQLDDAVALPTGRSVATEDSGVVGGGLTTTVLPAISA